MQASMQYIPLFRILAARKLEREQKIDEAGGSEAREFPFSPHHPVLRRLLLTLQFTRGQNAEKPFVRERLLRRLLRPH